MVQFHPTALQRELFSYLDFYYTVEWEISVSHNTKRCGKTEKLNNKYLYKRNRMKTLNLHTPNYQPATNMLWAGISVCDFNSKRIEITLGVQNVEVE